MLVWNADAEKCKLISCSPEILLLTVGPCVVVAMESSPVINANGIGALNHANTPNPLRELFHHKRESKNCTHTKITF